MVNFRSQSLFSHAASGGFLLLSAPTQNYNASFDFGIPITHIAYGSGDPDFNKDIDFNYEISSGKLYWYRVMMYCQDQIDSQDFCPAVDDVLGDLESINVNPVDNSSTYCRRLRMKIRPIRLSGVADIAFSQLSDITFEKGILESEYIQRDGPCGDLQGHLINIKCAQKKPVLTTAVMASDLDDLCRRLNRPTLGPSISNFRICSVVKFTTPIGESSGHGIASELEQQDISNISSCIDYNLDFNLTRFTTKSLCNNRFVFHAFVRRVYYHESNKKFAITGGASVQYVPVGEEGFAVFYSVPSSYTFSTYTYPEPEDSSLSMMSVDNYDSYNYISLHNDVDFLITPLIREFSGGFEILGTLIKFVFPIRNYNFLLNLSLSSKTKILYSVSVDSYNNLELLNSLNSVETHRFYHIGSQGPSIYGESLVQSSHYFYEGSGLINVYSDRSEIISGNRFYISEGGMVFSGSPSRLGRCVSKSDAGGIIEISGSSESYVVYNFKPSGSVIPGGIISGVVTLGRNFTPNNNIIRIEGDSDINFTNFGLLVSTAVLYSSYSEAAIEVAENINVLPLPPVESISSCGCSSQSSISLDHNIPSSGVISEFLSRNNLFLDSRIFLNYRAKTKSWFYTQTLAGLTEENRNLSLNLIFELSCTNILENQEFDENFFKFNFFARTQTSGGSSITNFVLYLSTDQICSDGIISSIISRSYDVDQNEYFILVNSNSISNNFYKIIDNIGIFSSDYWNNRLNYSKLRPQYYPSNISYNNPKVVGVWPEFKINFSDVLANKDYRSITLENPVRIDL